MMNIEGSKMIKPSDRIFIAGSRGMAGSAITRALAKKGYHKQLTPTREELDLLDDRAIKIWMQKEKPNVVVVAAAKVGGIEVNRSQPADFLIENLRIETQLIEAAWRSGVSKLLFLGSSCIYPKFASQPIGEEALLTGPLEPTNEWYAIAKIAGIKIVESLRLQYGFDGISLMPTNLYGPGDNYNPIGSHVLPALIRRFHEAKEKNAESVVCWGSGTPLREFLHADDLGDACVFALENWSALSPKAPKGEDGKNLPFLNVGTGVDLSIKKLAEKVARTINYKGKILWDKSKPDGTPKKQLKVERLRKLGWSAKITLDEGISLAYEDFCRQKKKGELRM